MSEDSNPASKTVTAKPDNLKVKWQTVGLKIKDQFKCFPQPNLANSETECILLEDSAQLELLMSYLKDNLKYETLLLINAIEYKEAFQIIYQLQSLEPYSMICLKVNLAKENPSIQSIHNLFAIANWYEREIWDLQGINFINHPDLKRILNPDEWVGFPLRKNYIPPLDALNGPITAIKIPAKAINRSDRSQAEFINQDLN